MDETANRERFLRFLRDMGPNGSSEARIMSKYAEVGKILAGIPPVRRRVFISYFRGDRAAAQRFVDQFAIREKIFIPRAIGLSYDGSDLIQSKDDDYVMEKIRESLIDDSSVQIVLLGKCTHSRQYIDWEIKRSLMQDNGLLGIVLAPESQVYAPDRLMVNLQNSTGKGTYGRWVSQQGLTAAALRDWIEDAYQARTLRAGLKVNPQEPWGNNRCCLVCRVTH